MSLASAIIGGATSLIGTGLNFGSARKNREMQIQLNRENNQFNAEQAQIQRDWTEQMYNQYQSPQALAQQYEDAGFNKYLAMKGGAGSVGSGSSASASGVPTLQAPHLDVRSIGETMASVANAIRISKEASWYDQNQIENLNYLRAQGTKLEGDTNWFNLSGKGLKFDRQLVGDTILAQQRGELKRIQLANDLLGQQAILANLDAETKRISNKFLPQSIQADLALQASQTASNMASVAFTEAKTATERENVKYVAQQTAESYARMLLAFQQRRESGQRTNLLASQTVSQEYQNKTTEALFDDYIQTSLDELITRGQVARIDRRTYDEFKKAYIRSINSNADLNEAQKAFLRDKIDAYLLALAQSGNGGNGGSSLPFPGSRGPSLSPRPIVRY